MNRSGTWMLCLVALHACGGSRASKPMPLAPETKKVVVSAPPDAGSGHAESTDEDNAKSSSAPPSHLGNRDFTIRPTPPQHVRFDGDLREWGSLVPESVRRPSHVAISFATDGLLIAGDLRTPADGAWLDLVLTESGFPTPAEYDHGSGGMIPLDCDQILPPDQVVPGRLTGFLDYKTAVVPSAQAACRRVMKKTEAMARAHAAAFRHVYRIDSSGLRRIDVDGKLIPVEGGKGATTRQGNRLCFELAIPNRMLPRALQAPLRSVSLGVIGAAASSPPPNDPNQRADIDVGEVRFEPGAALQELFFGDWTPSVFWNLVRSYQPGDPTAFEEVALCTENGLPSVCQRRGQLIKPGGPSVGAAQIHPGDIGNVLVVNGKPVRVLHGPVVARPNALHVVDSLVSFDDAGDLKYHASWVINIVDSKGEVNEVRLPGLICAPDMEDADCCPAKSRSKAECEPQMSHDADFLRLGIRSRGWREEDGSVVNGLRWAWDQAKGEYVSKTPPTGSKRH